jgi:integrase
MHEEGEFRSHARPGNHALISGCGQRRAAFRDEDVWGRWGFAQELAQRAAFPRRYRMHAGIPALAMLRHACGFKLANDGHDTRAIQAYLGHRSIMSTVRYTALTPNRFKNFWKD